jgi:aldehyde:ferredoxin oxidoreductase
MQKILVINLLNRTSSNFDWELSEVGTGLLGTLLLDVFHDIDGDSPIVIAGGAISGVPAVGLAVAYVVGHSPQSGGIVESKIEGRLASSLRYLNLAAIVIRNVSPSRVALKIRIGLKVDFIEAQNLFGHNVKESNAWFQSREEGNFVLGTVGTPGDYGLANASIVFDDGFPTSSGGLGADFGKRLLKLVAIEFGDVEVSAHVKAISDAYQKRIPNNPLTLSEFKSPGMGVWPVDPGLAGYLGAHNFTTDISPAVREFDSSKILGFVHHEQNSCIGCPQSCLKRIGLGEADGNFSTLHQQAFPIWFSQLGIADVTGSMSFNESCHVAGIEHASAGNMLAFLAQTSKDMEFGNSKSALKLLNSWQTNPKTFPGGTGKLLDATTAENASAMMQVKGIPLPPWDPRGAQGLGLIMAINPSGPRYDVVEHDIDFDLINYPAFTRQSTLSTSEKYGIPSTGFSSDNLGASKVLAMLGLWHLWSAMDSLGVCTYAGPPTRELTEDHILDLYHSITSSSLDLEKFLFLGKLRIEAQISFNAKVKVQEKLATLPQLFFDQPIKSGPSAGKKIIRKDFEDAKQLVYEASGWSNKGIPVGNTMVSKEHLRLKNLVRSKIDKK